MSSRLMLSHYTLCEVDLDYQRISVQGGADAPFLTLKPNIVKLNLAKPLHLVKTESHYTIISLSGCVYLQTVSKDTRVAFSCFSNTRIIARSWLECDQKFEIDLTLDYTRLNMLESIRSGGDLRIFIKGTATIALHETFKHESKLQVGGIIGFEEAELEMYVTIPQSHWVKMMLPKLGWGDFILLEVRTDSKILSKAHELLNKAQNAFDNWDTKSLAANCREIICSLTRSLPQHLGTDHPAYNVKWKRATKKKPEDFFSIALHETDIADDNDTSNVEFSRADAEFALSYIRILMRYAQELYKLKP
ncbi:MAG: hypothetical protein KAW14_03275 [Candidatus Aegiribacteria sp.]|nr:hypothetical protein [Candidatus Aegiribacteria sp.]